MTRVLFIHGTMTRYDEHYKQTFATIRDKLTAWQATTVVEKFPWGEYWGATDNPPLRSIPGVTRDEHDLFLGGASEEHSAADDGALSEAVMLWSLLYDDALAELRLLAARDHANDTGAQTGASAAVGAALYRLAEAGPSAELAVLLDEAELVATFGSASRWAAELFDGSVPELQAALLAMPEQRAGEYVRALARALVAESMRRARTPEAYPPTYADHALRDSLVAQLAGDLEADLSAVTDAEEDLGVLGVGAWVGMVPAGLLTGLVLRPFRAKLTGALLRFLGDVLVYQAKGARIRAEIAQRVLSGPPTVLLAHSLGGIACFELLREREDIRAHVPLLTTVGSQSPMLYELGALTTTAYQGHDSVVQLGPNFPPWLNILDSNDLLSFQAADLFAGTVRDVNINSAQPFPYAHNAYWRNKQTWEHILAALAQPDHIQYQLR